MNQNIVNNYIDKSQRIFKIARNFSVQYFGNCIPKGAVYGRPTNNLYIYIDDFGQFKPEQCNTRFNIWILDSRSTDGRFHKTTVSKHTEWYNLIFSFIEYNNLYDEKCVSVACMKRIGGLPQRKEAQGNTGYTYTVPYKHRKVLEWEATFCTETDAIQGPHTRIDREKTKEIQKKQERLDIARKEREIAYQKLKQSCKK